MSIKIPPGSSFPQQVYQPGTQPGFQPGVQPGVQPQQGGFFQSISDFFAGLAGTNPQFGVNVGGVGGSVGFGNSGGGFTATGGFGNGAPANPSPSYGYGGRPIVYPVYRPVYRPVYGYGSSTQVNVDVNYGGFPYYG